MSKDSATANEKLANKPGASGKSDKPEPKGTFAVWKKKLEDHLAEYGLIALFVYLTIWFTVWAGFAIAIAAGLEIDVVGDASAGMWGTILAAYVPTKLTQPLRIAATIVVTPIVAAVYHKVRGTQHVPKAERDARKAAKKKSEAQADAAADEVSDEAADEESDE